jgi:hypothetical protein
VEINDFLRDIEYMHNILGFLCIHTTQTRLRFDNQLIKTKMIEAVLCRTMKNK